MDPSSKRETRDGPRVAALNEKGMAFRGSSDTDGPGAQPPSADPPSGAASGTAGSVRGAGNEWGAYTTRTTYPELDGGAQAIARRLQVSLWVTWRVTGVCSRSLPLESLGFFKAPPSLTLDCCDTVVSCVFFLLPASILMVFFLAFNMLLHFFL